MLASGKFQMRRKTEDELRFQGLGTKNEKNLGSGQLPSYLELNQCNLPSQGMVNAGDPSRKKAISLPKSNFLDTK